MTVIAMLLIITGATMTKVLNVTSADPATTIFVDPPEVRDIPQGNTFLARINVSDAPTTYSWGFRLNWDRTLLNVSSIVEGDFLHRWMVNPFPPPDYLEAYQTSFAYTPLDEANAKGEALVGGTLVGPLPTEEWAIGNGWLATLNFTVKSTGSTLLNLFDTLLYDHIVADRPVSTPYPNNDGFFYNISPPIHDIRISKVTPLSSTAIRGTIVNINITVLNEGTVTEPSVTINVKANDTVIGTASLSLNGTGNSENRTYTYTVNWDTTGLAFGKYNITVSVPAVSGELDTADNFLVVGIVRLMLHDIAVTNVVTNATNVRIGETVSVNVTVSNVGSDAEAFDVSAYYDDFLIHFESFSSFASGSQTTLTFEWNTIFVSAGVYTMKANVTSATDTNIANNEFVNGDVTVYRETGWPTADFAYSPLITFINQTITFTSTSYDTDGYIVSWAWDFNEDGIIDATTETATWSYTAKGDHKVRLIVHDNDTLTPPIGTEKTIRAYARPIASFTYSPQNPLINEAVTFDASDSYDADGAIVAYIWDFGDAQTSTDAATSHTYTNFGTYTVMLNVTDNDGFKGTKSSEIRVTKTPIASFTFAPSSPLAFQTITFDASSSTPNGGSITEYFWDFGDDNIANETDPITTHSYSPADTYTVTLTITDSEGLTSTATQSIVVGKLSSTTSMNAPTSPITKGEQVTITGSISPERQGVTVMILYRLTGAQTWSTLNTATTNNNGQYSYDWTPTTAGTYEVKAIWEGDANTVGDESDIETITVQETSIIPDSNLLLIAGIIIVIAVAVAVYFFKFRKQKPQQGPPANPSNQ
jgi:PKD repeat protein